MIFAIDADFCTRFGATKPPLPYTLQREFVLHAHHPARPDYSPLALPDERYSGLRRTQHPVENCRIFSPAAGLPVQHRHELHVRVKALIRVRDGTGAQLVVVQVLSKTPTPKSVHAPSVDSEYIAKMYDPIYYREQDEIGAFIDADHDYQSEVAAYLRLRDLWGKCIPGFYGSYTTGIDTPFDRNMLGTAHADTSVRCFGPLVRTVQCILVERLTGTVMTDLPYDIPEMQSKAIMKGIVDAESQMWARDVHHGDLEPRNIIVIRDQNENGNENGDRQLRTVLIDFGRSTIGRLAALPHCTEDQRQRRLPGIYISPLLRWHPAKLGHEKPYQFAPWISWHWHPWLEDIYKADFSSITREMRDAYLSEHCLHRYHTSFEREQMVTAKAVRLKKPRKKKLA